MRSYEGKSILVLVDVVDRYLPSVGVVAQFAFRAVLAAMKVGMTVLALAGGVRKVEIRVAVAAGNRRVTAAQREAGARVIESDPAADDLPVLRGMTGCAGNVQLAVRALRLCHRCW
ncbi:hypothetical protein DYQ86_07555 [Acidobacteria bacterium AB60]|nr:hypothetical protein DYQ86_07555 [Acidobacteria bacterium AB60]